MEKERNGEKRVKTREVGRLWREGKSAVSYGRTLWTDGERLYSSPLLIGYTLFGKKILIKFTTAVGGLSPKAKYCIKIMRDYCDILQDFETFNDILQNFYKGNFKGGLK